MTGLMFSPNTDDQQNGLYDVQGQVSENISDSTEILNYFVETEYVTRLGPAVGAAVGRGWSVGGTQWCQGT